MYNYDEPESVYKHEEPKPRRTSNPGFYRTKSEGKSDETKSDKRDSDPTPMDEADFWKKQATHYRTEAENWERIASSLKVRLIRLAGICKSFSTSWERLLYGDDLDPSMDSPRDVDSSAYRTESYEEVATIAKRRMSRPEPLVHAVVSTSAPVNNSAVRTVSSDAIPPFTGFKHSTSVGALVMSKRTSYDDLDTLMQSGSPRALTPNHHNRNKSDPKSVGAIQQQPAILSFSDPKPAAYQTEEGTISSSSDSEVIRDEQQLQNESKENIKLTDQPNKKKKKGLFHRRHGSSNSDENQNDQPESTTEVGEQRSEHKKKSGTSGIVKSLATSNLYQLSQVVKDKPVVPQSKKKQTPISLVSAFRQISDLNGFLDGKGNISSLLDDIPNIKVSDKFGQEIGTLRSGKSSEKAFVIPKKACGVTTSTYPMITMDILFRSRLKLIGNLGKDQKSIPIRYGDPNCDRFGIKVYKHRILVCVTDGCGWGERSCRASEVANHAFMNYIENQHMVVEDTHSAAVLMLKGLQEAHEAIIQNVQNHWEAGTTTLCGGMLLKLEDDDEDGPRFGFLCANIGDCKAYLYNTDGPSQRSSVTIVSPKEREVSLSGPSSDHLIASSSHSMINAYANNNTNHSTNNTNVKDTNGAKTAHKVIDMTRGNRGTDARHTGGCLGPKLEKLKPRLDNLKLTWTICRPKDLIVLVSDGVHDNFDPEALGEQPTSVGLGQTTWLSVPQKESIEARDRYRANRLYEQIEGMKDPKKVTDTIIRYVVKTTHNQREFLEKNKGGQVPDDFVLYPGKMDHCTCVSFVVG